jgi:hypothetical protein
MRIGNGLNLNEQGEFSTKREVEELSADQEDFIIESVMERLREERE